MEGSCAFLGLGGNLGDRAAMLTEARRQIAGRIGILVRSSRIYRTQAWGLSDQPDFFNQVLQVQTFLRPEELLDEVLAIEREMGRERLLRWSARLIDIDVLLYDQEIIQTARLVVPHPYLPQRRFVLAPLVEIAPDVRHPELGKTMAELLLECPDPLLVEPIA